MHYLARQTRSTNYDNTIPSTNPDLIPALKRAIANAPANARPLGPAPMMSTSVSWGAVEEVIAVSCRRRDDDLDGACAMRR